MSALMKTEVPGYSCHRGKVRDVYNLGDGRIIIIATDRISAFDVVMENGIPDKGRVLTGITEFWLKGLEVDVFPNHLISTNLIDLPEVFQRPEFEGRIMLCKKASPTPIECIVRGFITGSAWRDYQQTDKVFGVKPAKELRECERLPQAVFTPTTKATTGHDENLTFTDVCKLIGQANAIDLRKRSLRIYEVACQVAQIKGIIIADTKFEFGRVDDQLILIDEVLTPDSSRFWLADQYQSGKGQSSFDKQFVRDYLQKLCDADKWDKNPPGPTLPSEIVAGTRARYLKLYKMLTGKELAV